MALQSGNISIGCRLEGQKRIITLRNTSSTFAVAADLMRDGGDFIGWRLNPNDCRDLDACDSPVHGQPIVDGEYVLKSRVVIRLDTTEQYESNEADRCMLDERRAARLRYVADCLGSRWLIGSEEREKVHLRPDHGEFLGEVITQKLTITNGEIAFVG